jgi:hypothetical protein
MLQRHMLFIFPETGVRLPARALRHAAEISIPIEKNSSVTHSHSKYTSSPRSRDRDWLRVGVLVPVKTIFSPLQDSQTGSGAKPTSYLMDNRGSFSGGKMAEV